MKGWKEDELGRVANYVKDKTDAKSLDASTYVSSENMLPDICGIVPSSYLPKDGKVLGFKKDDVLVSNIRPYFKKIWRAKYVGGCSNDILVFRSDVSKILPEFLYYQLAQNDFFDFMMAGANGVKMPRGNRDLIPKFKFKLPPLPTQKKIAGILSAYDDVIENNLRRIKLLEEMAQITYEEWFVRLRFPGHTTTPINKATSLPEGWENYSLSRLGEYLNGYAFKPDDLGSKGMPIIKIKEIKAGVVADTPRNSGEYIPNKYFVSTGDILFSWSASLEVVIWQNETGLLNQHLFKVTPANGIPRAFLYLSLRGALKIFDGLTTGATMKHIKRKELDFVEVIVPSKKIIDEFGQIGDSIFNEILNLSRQNQRLREARDILLPRLMTGVIDAEKYQPENLLKEIL